MLKNAIFRLNLLFNFAIIPLIGNNFKTKIFFLLKQIYGVFLKIQFGNWRSYRADTDLNQFDHMVSRE